MAAIHLQNVTKQFAGRVVLRNLTLELHAGRCVGIVGPNGAGKTTIFRLVTGLTTADFGSVTRAKDLQVGYLRQDPTFDDDRSLEDEIRTALHDVQAVEQKLHDVSERMSLAAGEELQRLMREYDRLHAEFIALGEHSYEQRSAEIMAGLGFDESDRRLPMSALSGGQKSRAALAKLLLQDATYLLLDEPTNHLDIDAVHWLEKFLANHHGGAAIISHDRYLLDRVASSIIEIDRGGAWTYAGNYTTYVETRQRDRLTQERQFAVDSEFIAKERDYIARHMAGQRSRQAKGRLTRLERALDAGELVTRAPSAERQGPQLEFNLRDEPRGVVLEALELRKTYGSNTLFADLTFHVNAGDRLGITGPNGAGKTTLLRVLIDELPPDAGAVKRSGKARLGYYAQAVYQAPDDSTVVSEIRSVRPEFDERRARSAAGAFLFSGEDAFKRVADLSGGERSRLRLLQLMLQSPSLLVLDEPTNHLDIWSREALESALADYPGTIIAVSHDRYFLDRIARRLLVLRPAGSRLINGNYSTYLEQVEDAVGKSANCPPADSAPRKVRKAGQRAAGAAAKKPPLRVKSALERLSLPELEKLIMKLEEEITAINQRFADPDTYRQGAQSATALRQELESKQRQLDQAQEAWLTRAE